MDMVEIITIIIVAGLVWALAKPVGALVLWSVGFVLAFLFALGSAVALVFTLGVCKLVEWSGKLLEWVKSCRL